jgi:serine/threonine-protein kinase
MSPSEDPKEPEELGTYMQFGTDTAADRDSSAGMAPPSSDFTPRSRESVPPAFEPTKPAFEPTAPSAFTPAGSGQVPQTDLEATQAHIDQTPISGGNPSAKSVDDDTFPADITPGLVLFNKYRTIRKLGAGGMGEVWLVKHEGNDDERALKLILPGQAFRPESRARFKQEAKIGAKIKHPNSVMVHDARIGESVAYIEMEYVSGASLDRLLRKGEPPPLAWTRLVLEQLCSILEFIHKPPISTIHRDLKPSNLILLDGSSYSPGCLKLCDLGIAKSLNTQDAGTTASFRTGAGAMLFTPQYASPEQINLAMSTEEGGEYASSDVDHRADIYALGVLMYQLLTGYLPFEGPFQAVILRHLNEPPPPFSKRNPAVKLPAALEKLVMRCLAKDRKDRPQSAREIFDEFLRALPEDDAGLSMPPTEPDYPALWPSRPTGTVDAMYSSSEFSAIRAHPEVVRGARRKQKILTWITALAILTSAGIVGKVAWDKQQSTGDGGSGEGGDEGAGKGKLPSPPVKTIAPVLADLDFKPDPKAPDVTKPYPSRILKTVGEKEVGFVLIRGGEFVMGHAPVENGPNASALEGALPPRKVTLSSFYMQEQETSNGEMDAYVGSPEFTKEAESRNTNKKALLEKWAEQSPRFGENMNEEMVEPAFPVSGIRHEMATAYAQWLGGKLPTEAQWEYAARSRGGDVLYPWDKPGKPAESFDDVKARAVIDPLNPGTRITGREKNEDRTAEGVFDMLGNVREWCRDRFMPSDSAMFTAEAKRALVDPLGPSTSWPSATSPFVIRGGSYLTFAPSVSVYRPRAYSSDVETPETIEDLQKYGSQPDLGFRIVIEVKDAPAGP